MHQLDKKALLLFLRADNNAYGMVAGEPGLAGTCNLWGVNLQLMCQNSQLVVVVHPTKYYGLHHIVQVDRR